MDDATRKSPAAIASTHHVQLFRNQPLDAEAEALLAEAPWLTAEDVAPDDHRPDHPTGALLLTCEACQETWRAPTGQGGKLIKAFWLCPNLCNLSEKVAGGILRAMDDGRREWDWQLAGECVDRLKRIRRPKRQKTIEVAHGNWLGALRDRIERRMAWAKRHSEWSPELQEEWDRRWKDD